MRLASPIQVQLYPGQGHHLHFWNIFLLIEKSRLTICKFRTLKVLFHCYFLFCIVWLEVYYNLYFYSCFYKFYVFLSCFLNVLKIVFISDFHQFDDAVPWCHFLLLLLIMVRIHLYSYLSENIVFIKFGNIWAFKNTFTPPFFTFGETLYIHSFIFPTCHWGSVNFFLLCASICRHPIAISSSLFIFCNV